MEIINPTETIICWRCGNPNHEKSFFCSKCGAVIGSKPSYYNETPGRGYYYDGLPLISLLVTIFGFFVAGFVGPLVGVILAHISLRRISRRNDNANRGLAVASLVIGYLMLVIGLILLIALGVFVGTALFHQGWTGGPWSNM